MSKTYSKNPAFVGFKEISFRYSFVCLLLLTVECDASIYLDGYDHVLPCYQAAKPL